MIPPEAITGMRTARTICGTNAMVPIIAASNATANVPRWAPASLPCATTASTPAASSATASSTVVAVPTMNIPAALAAASASLDGIPKVKLKIAAPPPSAASS
jgi:hypothetical protein